MMLLSNGKDPKYLASPKQVHKTCEWKRTTTSDKFRKRRRLTKSKATAKATVYLLANIQLFICVRIIKMQCLPEDPPQLGPSMIVDKQQKVVLVYLYLMFLFSFNNLF